MGEIQTRALPEALAGKQYPKQACHHGQADVQASGRSVAQGEEDNANCQGHTEERGGRQDGQGAGGGHRGLDEHAPGGDDVRVQAHKSPYRQGGQVACEDVDQEQAEGGQRLASGPGFEREGDASENEQDG